MRKSTESLEVWLDCDLGVARQLGTLSHNRGTIRFQYLREWIDDPASFSIDPSLSMDNKPFFPNPELGNFGIFMDSAPDRWGQTLMKRREALEAKDEKRSPRNLYAWDYLIGVQDLTRQGALRFRKEGETTFLGCETMAAPPVTSLKELEAVAIDLSAKGIHNLDAMRKWLAVLVAPGASLGGARPKANFTQADGSLWIGKFPAKDDVRDVGAWEFVAHQLADRAGIDVPEAKIVRLNSAHHTFCVKRFDRIDGPKGVVRRFYASAMTMLGKNESEGTSYLEIAEFLLKNGDPKRAQADLEQLFHRVAFNVAIGNRDDHLRNHGFLLGRDGWTLAKAFDVNPNIDKSDHVLNIDDSDNRPNLNTVLSTAHFYRLDTQRATEIVEKIVSTVADWRVEARNQRISNADIDLTEVAFTATQSYLSDGHGGVERDNDSGPNRGDKPRG